MAGALALARSLSRASMLVIVAAVLGGTQVVLGLLEAPTAVRVVAAALVVGVAVASEADKVQTKRREQRLAEQKEEEAQEAAEAQWLRRTTDALRLWPLQPISDVDPYLLGVSTSSLADKFPSAGQRLPPYVERDRDRSLRQRLRQRGLVLVVGAPASGATRTAFEAGLDAGDHRLVLAPRPPDGLRRALDELDVLSRLQPSAQIVVWLDGIDRFSPGGLTVMLREIRNRVSGSRVVATIPTSRYRAWAVEEAELAQQFGQPVGLDRLPSVEEKRRAQALYPGVDVSQGVAAAFTAVGSLLVRLRTGYQDCPHEPVGGDCPIVRAVVAAAAGWATTGTSRGLPSALLPRLVQRLYGLPNPLPSEHLSAAVAWAQAPTVEGASLIQRHANPATPEVVVAAHRELADVLAVQEQPAAVIWTSALDEATEAFDSDAIGRIGFNAHVAGERDAADNAWARIGTPDEAATAWLRRAAEFSRRAHDAPAELVPRQRLVDLLEQAHESDLAEAADELRSLGVVWLKLGQPGTAREQLERALHIQERAYGRDDPEVASTLGDLGIAWRGLGEPGTARQLCERALHIQERSYGPDDPAVAGTLGNLGNAWLDLGQPDMARELYERALHIQERAYGPDDPDVAGTLGNLGNAWRGLGRPDTGRKLHERALHIQERTYGQGHPEVATTLGNLGNTWRELGQPDTARELYERALRIQERAYGPNHPEVAATLGNLGNAWRGLGRPDTARKLHERALRIEERAYGLDHPEVATTLGNLGNSWQDLGQPDTARELYERALRIQERTYGPDHRKVAATLVNLGHAWRRLEQEDTARELFARAVRILCVSNPSGHPRTADAIRALRTVAPDVIVLDDCRILYPEGSADHTG